MENIKNKIKLENARVRFKNNKPYLAKKIAVTVFIIAIVAFFAIKMHWITNLLLFLFTGLPLMIKISKQPAEGKGFFGKVINYYKNLYKYYLIDVLPVEIEVSNNEIQLNLLRAEQVHFQTVDEKYLIKKDDIAGILYDDIEDDLLIMFQKAEIEVINSETKKNIRKTRQHNSTICTSIKNYDEMFDLIKKLEYPIEKLSEIVDAEQETEDPELLVHKLFGNKNLDELMEEQKEKLKEKQDKEKQEKAEKKQEDMNDKSEK